MRALQKAPKRTSIPAPLIDESLTMRPWIHFSVLALLAYHGAGAAGAQSPTLGENLSTWHTAPYHYLPSAVEDTQWIFLVRHEVRTVTLTEKGQAQNEGDAAKLAQLRRQAAPYDVPLPVFPLHKRYIINGFYPKLQVLAVEDGWLVGIDNGEWGGALLWFDRQIKHQKIISRARISGLFKLNGKLIAISNRTHMAEDEMVFFQVVHERTAAIWSAHKIKTWPEGALVMQQQENQNVLFLFNRAASVMSPLLEMNQLCRFGNLGSKIPSSDALSAIYLPSTDTVFFSAPSSVGMIHTKRCDVRYLVRTSG